MGQVQTPQFQELSQLRDVLVHYYDYAYLVRHALVQRFQRELWPDSALAVQRFRHMLLEIIETLRPGPQIPLTDPAWRPYTILHERFVLGKDASDLEQNLSLGLRQIQREQRRAFEAVAQVMLDRYPALAEAPPVPPQDEVILREEISRAASEQAVFDATEQMEGVVRSVGALVAHYQIGLSTRFSEASVRLTGYPTLFKQMLVVVFSLMIKLAEGNALRVSMACHDDQLRIVWDAISCVRPPPELPDALLLLAEVQGAVIESSQLGAGWRVCISLPATRRKTTIVLVEDNRDLVALFSRYLGQHGYHLVAITDSETALEQIRVASPDAIVLDLMMRGIDGWEVLQRIKGDPQLAHVPVVICSVLDEAELAMSLGAHAYLRKPVRPAEIHECLLKCTPRSGVA